VAMCNGAIATPYGFTSPFEGIVDTTAGGGGSTTCPRAHVARLMIIRAATKRAHPLSISHCPVVRKICCSLASLIVVNLSRRIRTGILVPKIARYFEKRHSEASSLIGAEETQRDVGTQSLPSFVM